MNDELGLFDDVNSDSIGEYSLESGSDNFSFDDGPVDDSSVSAGNKQTSLERNKRNAALPNGNSRELQFESLKFDSERDATIDNAAGNKGRRKNKNRPPSMPSSRRKDEDNEDNKDPILDKLVKDIKQKVRDSRKFWSNLPYQICNNEDFSAPPSSDANCWNGNGVDR